MISESSSNGVLEFDALANAKTAQPAPMVEARLLDEVTRAERLYEAQRLDFKAGLMFFTYEDEYDNSIDLKIGGAVSMPRVLSSIFRLSSKG